MYMCDGQAVELVVVCNCMSGCSEMIVCMGLVKC